MDWQRGGVAAQGGRGEVAVRGGRAATPSRRGGCSSLQISSTSRLAVMRSYQGYYTRSHQNSEVKRLWAGIVLGWVTSREVPVLHPLFLFKSFNTLCSHVAAAYWSMPPRTDHGQPSIMFQNENS